MFFPLTILFIQSTEVRTKKISLQLDGSNYERFFKTLEYQLRVLYLGRGTIGLAESALTIVDP